MKRVFLSITSIFMILALLINTAGITVYPHFCIEDGDISLNFFKKENCCPTKHHQVKEEHKSHACCQKKGAEKMDIVQHDKCCTQESFTAQWQLNVLSFEKQIQITLPVIALDHSFGWVITAERNFLPVQKTESPPLLYSGRDILTLKQSYLI